MPPRPLAEDLARKKAERDKQKKAQEALAILEKPSGFEQAVNAVKDPVGTMKQLGRVAKETFYDPSKRFAAAVDPNSGASLPQRAAGLAESALYAADFLTPVPEQALYREAMEKALDREVAGYASRGGGQRYRGVLGVHGSPVTGLTQIEPRAGSFYNPNESVAWFWDAKSSMYNPDALAQQAREYAGPQGELYISRFPRPAVNVDYPTPDYFEAAMPNYSREPGNVVSSVKMSPEMYTPEDGGGVYLKPESFAMLEGQMWERMGSVMTPSERRIMDELPQLSLPRREDAIRRAAMRRQLARHAGDF